jgi:hypothetical protein
MNRRAWAIFLPLAFAGWLLSHCLAYQFVGPADEPHHMLESGGHGGHAGQAGHAYLPAPATLLAAALVVVLAGFVATVVASARGARWSRLSVGTVAVLPALAFILQEHLEDLIATGAFPPTAGLEPTFWVGLLLQLPIVLACLVVGRGLLATATRVGAGLRALFVRRVRTPRLLLRPLRPRTIVVRTPWLLASDHQVRAPPLLLLL